MSRSSRDEWFALHTQYLVSSDASDHGLLLDSQTFLDSAHGVAQALSDAMSIDHYINPDQMSSALNGIALLIEMGRRCVAQAELQRMVNSCH